MAGSATNPNNLDGPSAAVGRSLELAGLRSLAPYTLLAGLYLVGMAATIDWHGFWSDEFHTIRAVQLPICELVRQRAAVGHPPLFFLLEKAWVGIVGGTSEAAYRALPALWGLGTLLLTYQIVQREAGLPAACLACGLLLTSATQLLVCHVARSYTQLQFLVTAHLALVLSPRPATAGRLALSTALSAAAFYTHGAALIAIFTHLAAVALVLPTRWKYLLSGAAGSFLYVPFVLAYPGLEEVESHVRWIPPTTEATIVRFPALLQFGRQLLDTPLVVQLAAGLLIVGLAILALRLSDAAALLGLQWFFTWAAAAAAASLGIGVIAVERYFVPAVMCQASFLAMAVAWLARSRWRLGSLAASGVVVVGIISSGLYFAWPPFTPWREMAALVRRERSLGEAVVVAEPGVFAAPFVYYYDGPVGVAYAGTLDLPLEAPGIWVCYRFTDQVDPTRWEHDLALNPWPRREVFAFRRGAVVHCQR